MIGNDLIKRAELKRRLAERIRKSYFVRFHMILILSATVISGVICSKLLSLLGVTRMPVRYSIAIILSYLLFFLFIKLWLLYIGVGRRAKMKKGKGGGSWWGDLTFRSSRSSGGAPRFTGFGGGTSGGGGSGAGFTEGSPQIAMPVGVGDNPGVAAGSHGGGGSFLDGVADIGDEGILKLLAILLLVALVLAVVAVGVYLVWCAPTILSDAAFHMLLVTNLSRKVRRVKESNWKMSILKATWWGFLLVLALAIAFGIVAQLYNPAAVTVRDLFTGTR